MDINDNKYQINKYQIKSSCCLLSRTTTNTPSLHLPDPVRAPITSVRYGSHESATKALLSIITFNGFQVLAEEEEEAHETRLIGVFIVRSQLENLRGKKQAKEKRLCMSVRALERQNN